MKNTRPHNPSLDKNAISNAGNHLSASDLRKKVQDVSNLAQPILVNGTLNDLLTLPFAALQLLPESCREIAIVRAAMNSSLLIEFNTKWLSPAERQNQQTYNAEAFPHPSLRAKWDRYILEEAVKEYGAMILLSDHVMARVWSWTKGEQLGSKKLRTLFDRMCQWSRISLKVAKGSITITARSARQTFVPEIEELQRRLREAWPDTASGVRLFVSKEIDASHKLRHLKKNAPQLAKFLADDRTALNFRGDPDRVTITPVQFFTKLLAWSKNRSEESVRQDLYRKE
jgi:hypothetical protein